jgi:hypothetical protein
MKASTRTDNPPDPGVRGTDTEPGVLLERLRRLGQEPTRALDFLFGAMFLLPWVPPLAPEFLSVSVLGGAGLVALAALRRPPWGLSGIPWLVPGIVVVLLYVSSLSALTSDTSLYGWPKRALRLALFALVLVALVGGRVHLPSVVRGAGAAIIGNALLFFAGAAPRPYGDYLSGFLMDKNVAGLAIAVVGLLLAGLAPTTTRRTFILLIATALLWSTGSRTSLAAFGCGIAWLVLRPRLGSLGRLLLAAALAYGIRLVEVDFARVGTFADREGSDALRTRIDAASTVKVDATPWLGSGLGDAFVVLDGRNFFFHNSYWSALVEGGWFLLTAYLVVIVWFGIGPLRQGPPPVPWVAAAEAANVAVLVCALRLGEVFGTAAGTLALGAGLLGHVAYRAAVRDREHTGHDPAGPHPRPGVSRATHPR